MPNDLSKPARHRSLPKVQNNHFNHNHKNCVTPLQKKHVVSGLTVYDMEMRIRYQPTLTKPQKSILFKSSKPYARSRKIYRASSSSRIFLHACLSATIPSVVRQIPVIADLSTRSRQTVENFHPLLEQDSD